MTTNARIWNIKNANSYVDNTVLATEAYLNATMRPTALAYIKYRASWYFFFCGATAHIGPKPPRLEVTRPHTIRYTYQVGLLWTNDQHVVEAATYTTHKKHKRRTSMPSAGFEPDNPEIQRLQTYALDSTATGIGAGCCHPSVFGSRR
jgi:hypothetical protein